MSPLSRTFQILNIILSILAVVFSAAAILFFLAVQYLTSVRNQNRYHMDETIHIPIILPWIIVALAVCVLFVALCGCIGAAKNRRSLLTVYIAFMTIIAAAFIAVAVFAYLHPEMYKKTENFTTDTILDVFVEMKSRKDAASVFHRMEELFRCCGTDSPRRYPGDLFPPSCCDSGAACPITDMSANARYGCVPVVTTKVGWIMKRLSAGAIALSFVAVLCLYLGLRLSMGLRSKTKSWASLSKKSKHIETETMFN